MKKLIATALVAGSLALPAACLPPPAQADLFGGSVRHYSPDGGADFPIDVYCNGRWVGVPEGQHSDHICGPNGSEDVNRVRVRSNYYNLRCLANDGLGFYECLDGDEHLSRKVANFQNLIVVLDTDAS